MSNSDLVIRIQVRGYPTIGDWISRAINIFIKYGVFWQVGFKGREQNKEFRNWKQLHEFVTFDWDVAGGNRTCLGGDVWVWKSRYIKVSTIFYFRNYPDLDSRSRKKARSVESYFFSRIFSIEILIKKNQPCSCGETQFRSSRWFTDNRKVLEVAELLDFSGS